MPDITKLDKSWTLFLDRDGVINHDKAGSYIFNKNEFVFYDGVPDAIRALGTIFSRIIVVTNQRGVGRGLMTEADLEDIHRYMLEEIRKAGGHTDAIYYCTSLDDNDPDRKPHPGMAFNAKKDFPEIIFNKSIMVGNNLSDMEFGRNAGMHTVFLTTTNPDIRLPHPAIDLVFKSLLNFSEALVPR
jgi:D,D-heptose 1,7-bisphosphate phosphatase